MEPDNESENNNPLNEIEQHLINDLQDHWQEPATRGDLRNMSVRMDSRFNKLGSQIDAKFVAVDAKFIAIDVRFDKIDVRFDKIDARFDKMDTRFDKMDARFDNMDSRFTKQDSDLKEYVNKMGWKFAGITISTTLVSMIGILGVLAAWIK